MDCNTDGGITSCATSTVTTLTTATGTMPVISHHHQSSLTSSPLISNININDVSGLLVFNLFCFVLGIGFDFV